MCEPLDYLLSLFLRCENSFIEVSNGPLKLFYIYLKNMLSMVLKAFTLAYILFTNRPCAGFDRFSRKI